jgi:VWFA-related protein
MQIPVEITAGEETVLSGSGGGWGSKGEVTGKATRGRWTFVVITAIALGGCAGVQNRHAILPSAQIAAPLKLCTPVAVPPKDLFANPGFIQFAVSVRDSLGRPVKGLKRSDFAAHAGGQILPIQYFQEEPDGAPTSIVIVMDLSGIMRGELIPHLSKVEAVQKALPDAVDRLNGCDELAILAFGGNEFADEHAIGQTPGPGPYPDLHETPIRLLQPFTTDHRLALMRLADRRAYGLAPLYDAIQQGLNLLESAHYQNRALIVITDGVDNSSALKKEDLIASVEKSGVPVYAIGLGEPHTSHIPRVVIIPVPLPIPIPIKTGDVERVDAETLEKLTAPNGGQLLIVAQPMQNAGVTLTDELNSIAAALNHGYAIGVVAPAGSGRPEIAVANRRQLKVRAHVTHGSQ